MSRESSKQNLSARLFPIGQDLTPSGSSTVRKQIETTGFHPGYGNSGERV
ncbi:MAG TPA: hypothetical protein VF599_07385 [Pyrinomonadaceae bacterium]|jgi:hypothetical protein